MDRTAALELAEQLLKRLIERRKDIAVLDDYYAGVHPLKYATEEWGKDHSARYQDFSDNWCGVVGDSPTERLRVSGFRLDTSSAMTQVEKDLWRAVFQNNDLEAQSAQGFLQSVVTARSFAIVWANPDDDSPLVTWEHPSQVLVEVDPENPRRRTAAIKSWTDDDFEYLTLYLPDELWKWQRSRASKSGLVLPSGYGAGEWLDRAGEDVQPVSNPLGVVPVVEFGNRPRLGTDPMSDIAGTMAMQDAINLLWAYLFTAADFASMPARVVLGANPPMVPILDENGQKVGEKPVDEKLLTRGRMLWLTGQTAKIDSWAAAELKAFTNIVEVAVGHIAAQTRTPQHYLVGKMANLSGDALKAAETGLVKKVEEAQLHFTAPMREVFRLGAMVMGEDGLADAARAGTVVWKDAESRSEAQLVDALSKLRDLGFPLAWVAERYGLSDSEITRVMQMIRDEADDPLLARVADKLTAVTGAADAAPSGV